MQISLDNAENKCYNYLIIYERMVNSMLFNDCIIFKHSIKNQKSLKHGVCLQYIYFLT